MGVWKVLLGFLEPSEQFSMQLGSKFCYESAIGRVLTYFIFMRPPIPFRTKMDKFALYDLLEQKTRLISNQ